jgi:hypothetical protein
MAVLNTDLGRSEWLRPGSRATALAVQSGRSEAGEVCQYGGPKSPAQVYVVREGLVEYACGGLVGNLSFTA